jgi:hypothetical protein
VRSVQSTTTVAHFFYSNALNFNQNVLNIRLTKPAWKMTTKKPPDSSVHEGHWTDTKDLNSNNNSTTILTKKV